MYPSSVFLVAHHHQNTPHLVQPHCSRLDAVLCCHIAHLLQLPKLVVCGCNRSSAAELLAVSMIVKATDRWKSRHVGSIHIHHTQRTLNERGEAGLQRGVLISKNNL
ncbi:Dynamin GTPase [Echinococcus multilocularis]|uniref:Dynamin GTPase n=1 Tax=Echinococcus multilocularis TaxID=6211 RepID=A0A0S4MLT2_ECHMU|nr:Dynamin GTPase [Echinococcus multilocularis]